MPKVVIRLILFQVSDKLKDLFIVECKTQRPFINNTKQTVAGGITKNNNSETKFIHRWYSNIKTLYFVID